MEIKWQCPLPTNEHSVDYRYESPILILGDWLYFAMPEEEGTRIYHLHKETGEGMCRTVRRPNPLLPHDYFFLAYENTAVLYTGDLHFFRGDTLVKRLYIQSGGKGKVVSHLVYGDALYLICSNGRTQTLESVDLKAMEWGQSMDISKSTPYQPGSLEVFGDQISFFGRDQLLFVDPSDFTISRGLTLPRIGKLFCPIPLDGDTMVLGYTNWSNAGILKYSTATKKILWRNKRNFEGPQLNCKVYLHNGRALWVKNGRELIAVDIDTGEEKYCVPTLPWAYTDLRFWGDRILYGTAGANGYLNCVHSETGEILWSVFLRNGCAYYDIWQDHAYVGDFGRSVKKISLQDGAVVEEYPVDAEVVGQHIISDGSLYTVLWGNDQKPIRLVSISLQP